MRNIAPTLLLLISSTVAFTGCAISEEDDGEIVDDGSDGKADGTAASALVVRATTTTLEPGVTIRWPKVTGGTQRARDAINKTMAYKEVTGETIEETKRNYAETHTGTTGADFTVGINAKGMLGIALSHEYSAAYPSTEMYYFNFDSNTGASLHVWDLLRMESLGDLAKQLDVTLQQRIAAAKAEHVDPNDPDSGVSAETYEGFAFTTDYMDRFSITKTGITFHYEFGFPHALLGAEPDGDIALTWAQLAAFERADGLLGKF